MDIKMDTTGALSVESGDLELVINEDAIAQDLKAAILLVKGNYFLDVTKGLPWFGDILTKKPNFVIIENVIKAAILERNGILEITEFSLEFNNSTRQLAINFGVLTDSGSIFLSEVI